MLLLAVVVVARSVRSVLCKPAEALKAHGSNFVPGPSLHDGAVCCTALLAVLFHACAAAAMLAWAFWCSSEVPTVSAQPW